MRGRTLLWLALLAAASLLPSGAGATPSHPEHQCLDVTPESGDADFFDGPWELSATLVSSGDGTCAVPTDGTSVSFELTGASDPDDSMSPESPDLECVIADGSSSCSVHVELVEDGYAVTYAWIEFENDGVPDLDRSEAPNEAEQAGSHPEPDHTDVVEFFITHRDLVPECDDDVDNDDDGMTDHPDDTDCQGPEDNSERPPECSDGLDNDGDGYIDTDDPNCEGAGDHTEGTTGCPARAGGYSAMSGCGFPTSVTIQYLPRDWRFHGIVGSAREGCMRGRELRLMRVRQGPDRFVGMDRSNRYGRWRIYQRQPRGRYYVIARGKVLVAGDRRFRCLRDTSPTIRVRS